MIICQFFDDIELPTSIKLVSLGMDYKFVINEDKSYQLFVPAGVHVLQSQLPDFYQESSCIPEDYIFEMGTSNDTIQNVHFPLISSGMSGKNILYKGLQFFEQFLFK